MRKFSWGRKIQARSPIQGYLLRWCMIGLSWMVVGTIAIVPMHTQAASIGIELAQPVAEMINAPVSRDPVSNNPVSNNPVSDAQIGHDKIIDNSGAIVAPDVVIATLAHSQVIYLGETHDNPADHATQLAIIQTLYQQQPHLTIALEMFQRPDQPALDDYLADRISEVALLTQTEYNTRWGFDWEFYAPIVRFAKAHQIPIVALNTPTAVTRKVSRQGLASLTPTDQQFIPPIAAVEMGVKTSAPAYRDRLRQVFESMHQGQGNALRFERFFTAQVLWDETMADRVDYTLQQMPQRRIIVLAGHGHIIYGHGIPSRVQRRQPALNQKTILLNPDATIQTQPQGAADWLWTSIPTRPPAPASPTAPTSPTAPAVKRNQQQP